MRSNLWESTQTVKLSGALKGFLSLFLYRRRLYVWEAKGACCPALTMVSRTSSVGSSSVNFLMDLWSRRHSITGFVFMDISNQCRAAYTTFWGSGLLSP